MNYQLHSKYLIFIIINIQLFSKLFRIYKIKKRKIHLIFYRNRKYSNIFKQAMFIKLKVKIFLQNYSYVK